MADPRNAKVLPPSASRPGPRSCRCHLAGSLAGLNECAFSPIHLSDFAFSPQAAGMIMHVEGGFLIASMQDARGKAIGCAASPCPAAPGAALRRSRRRLLRRKVPPFEGGLSLRRRRGCARSKRAARVEPHAARQASAGL